MGWLAASADVWVALIVKTVAVIGMFFVFGLVIGYIEHKTLAHMQARLGPMEAGRFHGWAQLIADAVKFVQKEDVIPTEADRGVFSIAPAVVLVPYVLVFLVIPFSADLVAADLDVGIFFVLAATGVSVIGVFMAGWASANKFSLIGALRAAAQLIAYELPLILAAAAVVMQAGTLSLLGIVEAQSSHWFILTQPVGFLIFLVATVAELSRSPFDMPIADSEIIAGAYTEYTGIKFAFFMLSEYGGMVAMSAIAAVMFLGGFLGPVLPPLVWMLAKTFFVAFFIIWFKATYPRLREDQLQRFAWLVLVPLALVNILVTAVFKVAV
jgi:NADH-quinone oxidoreductase subunit H